MNGFNNCQVLPATVAYVELSPVAMPSWNDLLSDNKPCTPE